MTKSGLKNSSAPMLATRSVTINAQEVYVSVVEAGSGSQETSSMETVSLSKLQLTDPISPVQVIGLFQTLHRQWTQNQCVSKAALVETALNPAMIGLNLEVCQRLKMCLSNMETWKEGSPPCPVGESSPNPEMILDLCNLWKVPYKRAPVKHTVSVPLEPPLMPPVIN